MAVEKRVYRPLVEVDAALDAELRERFARRFVTASGLPESRLDDAATWLTLGVAELPELTEIEMKSAYTGSTKWYLWQRDDDPAFVDEFADDCATEVNWERKRDGGTEWDDPGTPHA